MLFWPFMLLTVALTAGLGYLIAQIEREKVMSDWSNKRCQVPIMAMGSYFKPKDDPRTPSQFSKDNFSFCMDSLVKTVTSQVMTPIGNVFSKQAGAAGIIGQTVNAIRVIVKKIYDAFMEYMDEFFRKYYNIAQQVRTVTLHLKAAFGRVNAMMMSMIYVGLTMIRGMMNTIDFAFKVVLIILGIMVALLILLWFILFPFIPLILSVIGAIVAVAVGTMAGTAASYKSAFCFAPTAHVAMEDGTSKQIKDIELGDILFGNIKVDSVMKMSGKEVPLWCINGVYVTGSHLVQSETDPNCWHPVQDDPRAKKTSYVEGYVYCLNTSTHKIPIQTNSGDIIYFRDWEELEDTDIEGHREWNDSVLSYLNVSKLASLWSNEVSESLEYPSIAPGTCVRTPKGLCPIIELDIGDTVYDDMLRPTTVLGIVRTTTHIPEESTKMYGWSTNMIELSNGIWQRIASRTPNTVQVTGYNIITESGTFIVTDGTNDKIYRDYTEVGYRQIESTNKCVEARLRSQVKKMS